MSTDIPAKLVGVRMAEPNEHVARIVRTVEGLENSETGIGFFAPIHDRELMADLMANLEPGQRRDIVAITPERIVWADDMGILVANSEPVQPEGFTSVGMQRGAFNSPERQEDAVVWDISDIDSAVA